MTEPVDRRQEILAVSAQLFASKGIGATSVRDIAAEVGLLSGSLYHHFDSKDTMVEEILTGYLGGLLDRYRAVVAAQPEPRACVADLITVTLQTAETDAAATQIYQNDLTYLRSQPRFEPILAAGVEVQKVWLSVIGKGVKQGAFRSDVDPKVFYRLIRDALWLSIRWHRPGGPYDTAQLTRDATTVFLDGFAAPSKPTKPRKRAKPTKR